MRTISIMFDLFEPLCDSIRFSEEIVHKLIELMISANREYIRCKGAPLIYESGVVYRREPPGREEFKSIPVILRTGHADCEDLAAWRVAELREQGEPARIVIKKWVLPSKIPGEPFYQYHVLLIRQDGTLEDPSAILGMRGRA